MSPYMRPFIVLEAEGEDSFEVTYKTEYIGFICKSKKLKKWAATWNMIPNDDDKEHYKHASKEDAVDELVRLQQEFNARRSKQ